MRRKQLRGLYLKKTGASRVILPIYYTASCASVNSYAKSRRLSVINKGALGISCELAYHVLFGGVHIKADGIVLELLVFQIKCHPTFIIGLLLGSVFLGEQSTRSTADSLSGVREPRVVFSTAEGRTNRVGGTLREICSENGKRMKSCIFRTFHNPRGLVFNYALLIRIVHI